MLSASLRPPWQHAPGCSGCLAGVCPTVKGQAGPVCGAQSPGLRRGQKEGFYPPPPPPRPRFINAACLVPFLEILSVSLIC